MSKIFMTVFLIFGTVVGSGFSSGKEIMVFFSRFGVLSYLYIILAGFLFFWIFYFFLNHGKSMVEKIEKSKILNFIIVFIALVFCSSMFAGIKNLFNYFPVWLYAILIGLLVVLCIITTLKGIKGLEKLNMILMPTTAIVFLIVLFYALTVSSKIFIQTNSWAGLLYCALYVCLNTSMSGLIISKLGGQLTSKQCFYASLFSALMLSGFLLLGNFVLQQNTESFVSDMPFLSIVKENPFMFVLTYIVILIGCFTTLISLCLTLKSSFDKLVKNEILSTLIAVFLPFLISSLGFSQIVSMLYPLCSVLGILVLLYLILETFRKKS